MRNWNYSLFWGNIRFALRILRKSPGFSAAAIAMLALSIGATSAVFSIINAVMLRPLPYQDPQQLMVVWGTDKRPLPPDSPPVPDRLRNKTMISSDVAERWRALSQSFDQLAWYRPWRFNATTAGDPERVQSGLVSADFFKCLRASTVLGRTFAASEMDPGNDQVVVLGNSFWRNHFGSDPNVIGQTVQLDGVSHTVIGVLAEDFQTILPFVDSRVDLWAPISREYKDKRRWSVVTAIGRLKPGVPQERAQSEMDAIAKQLEPEGRRFQNRGVNLVRLDREMVSDSKQALLVVFGAVAAVLLIACANLAGLLLAHTLERQREIGIRTALGATRGRILRQLLTECLLLSVIGGMAGIVLSTWLARVIVSMQPADIPRLDSVSPDANVLLFGLGLSVLTTILFGLLPVLQFSQTSLTDSFRKSVREPKRRKLPLTPRNLLLVGEIGLTVMLLVGTGLLVRSFASLRKVDPGFKPERLLTMVIPLSETSYSNPAQQAEFANRLLERVQAIPSVESAAVSNSLPMQNTFILSMPLQIEGRQMPADTSVAVRAVSDDYFRTMQIPLLRGRDFTSGDVGQKNVVIINRELAEQFWPGSDPVGMRIVLEKSEPRTIIGVVREVKSSSLDTDPETELYVPFAEQPASSVGLALRSSGDPQLLVANIKTAVREIDPNQPIAEVATMQKMIDDFFERPRFNFMLFGSFAVLALTLSIVGIYALVSHSVARRTHEIGIRMALGAQRRSVLFLFMRDGAFIAIAGIALGLIGAAATVRLLANMLFGIPPQDSVTFAAVSIALLVVCLAATYFPARRAMKIDPIITLRYE
ncbi:MAG TPA: ABC transporter permease [Pyrinomonadaceae bacterium]|nr:ABC transporter permease [Pyrinomonadaceae bacterium]